MRAYTIILGIEDNIDDGMLVDTFRINAGSFEEAMVRALVIKHDDGNWRRILSVVEEEA
jgi:hypothetical protein